MDCEQARTYLLDRRRGTLAADALASLEAHLASCAECRREDAADDALSTALEKHLPRPRASEPLRRALEARWGQNSRESAVKGGGPRETRGQPRAFGGGWQTALVGMAAGVALALLGMVGWRQRTADLAMVTEAVNDHLRVLYNDRPLGVESGGIHQVKPWFEGRVDFAPVVPFDGDDEFVLQGGAVGYFLDRKAATFVYRRRLHLITLFVFPSQGLPWSPLGNRALGSTRAEATALRGFHVLLWREGDLGYALVSDVDEAELDALGRRIAR